MINISEKQNNALNALKAVSGISYFVTFPAKIGTPVLTIMVLS